MKVSIITPVLNNVKTVGRTIESVISQRHDDIEYIVVDGNSVDGTREVLNEYADKITHIISEEDDSLYDAINKGILKATGDIIGILNSDDIFNTRKIIGNVVNEFEQYGMDSLYGNLVYTASEDSNRIKRYWRGGEFVRGKMKWGWMPPHPTFYCKRKVYLLHGLYDSRLGTSADYELMLRLLYIKEISTHYHRELMVRMSSGGISNRSIMNRIKANAMDSKAWKVNKLDTPPFFRILKPLLKLSQFKVGI